MTIDYYVFNQESWSPPFLQYDLFVIELPTLLMLLWFKISFSHPLTIICEVAEAPWIGRECITFEVLQP